MLNRRNGCHIECVVQIHVEQPADPLARAACASPFRKCEVVEHTHCEVFLGLALAGVDAVDDLNLVVFGLHQCGDVAVHSNNLCHDFGNESLLKSGKALCLVEADVVFEFLCHFVCRVVYCDYVVYCDVHIYVCNLMLPDNATEKISIFQLDPCVRIL